MLKRLANGQIASVDPIERFWSKVDQSAEADGCWLWSGAHNDLGYGQLWAGWMAYAHRFAYELLIGPIPLGLDLDHLCRNPGCVNPAHLEPVTHRENLRRGQSPSAIAVRTGRCQRGHELTHDNVFVRRSGKRLCRACARLRDRRRDARVREVRAVA